jgi:hypothetical protein
MTYQDAINLIPADAKWTCSFGYVGTSENYSEWFRSGNRRYVVAKADHYAGTWTAYGIHERAR